MYEKHTLSIFTVWREFRNCLRWAARDDMSLTVTVNGQGCRKQPTGCNKDIQAWMPIITIPREISMNYAQRELFIINLRQQFTEIFLASKAGKDNTEQRLRAQGFIHAGELLEICSRQEVQQLMEKTHIDVFGISIAERKPSELTLRQQALKLGNYDYFDEPAFNRLQ